MNIIFEVGDVVILSRKIHNATSYNPRPFYPLSLDPKDSENQIGLIINKYTSSENNKTIYKVKYAATKYHWFDVESLTLKVDKNIPKEPEKVSKLIDLMSV